MTGDQVGWVHDRITPPLQVGPRTLMLHGSGPVPEADWRSRLTAWNRGVYFPDQKLGTRVVGREDLDEATLRTVVANRRGLALRVYTQEMLLAFLVSREDPYEEALTEVRRLWGDHPALAFFDRIDFDWPTQYVADPDETADAWLDALTVEGPEDAPQVEAAPESEAPALVARRSESGSGDHDFSGLHENGILSSHGYRVGRAAPRASVRRRALERALEDDALSGIAVDRRDGYGEAGSAERLERIAWSIAGLYFRGRRHPNDLTTALNRWAEDLEWLKTEYYSPAIRRHFNWPRLR